jgi:hypothetical protein
LREDFEDEYFDDEDCYENTVRIWNLINIVLITIDIVFSLNYKYTLDLFKIIVFFLLLKKK